MHFSKTGKTPCLALVNSHLSAKKKKKKKKKNDLFSTTTTFSHKLYKFELYIQLEKEVNKKC